MTRRASPISKRSSRYDKHVGVQLRSARTGRRMSQSALGERLGVTFQQIQKYERGTNRISAGRLYEIALLLEVDVSHFYQGLGREEPRVPLPDDEATILFRMVARVGNAKIRMQLIEFIGALARAWPDKPES